MIPLQTPRQASRPTAIALGSFDGLHRGHRRVIAAVTAAGAGVPTVVSFWPHPREVLHGEPRLRLDLPSEKLELLEPLGIAQLVLVPFDRQLAALEPEAFVDQVLVGQLDARRIAVGDNFRFGAGRCGDARDLQAIGSRRGIAVTVLPMLWDGAERVSSSRIRRALAAGDIAEARRLLERPYRFRGVVVRGRGLGRTLGWPTANLQVDGRKFLPLEGVYAARAQLQRGAGGEGGWMPAVMNLGPQPTVDPAAPSAVEVHLLDRRLELVGRELKVEPLALLRRQQRFEDLEALSAQIAADAERARLLCRGVGVGEAPDDEGGDAPQQQDS
ncbi:bifunctional riboflavin kinase/FAD synthetase [Cyanobium sp. CH-040]|uniref:bifunctional riboflavin kinase/FAD synthetase n=1 Tax=Cyanobium sp. CH-040 TaxID=2823708 RepID=UPI0028F3FF0F|nr:bifunctional riboflavin kinase/FAD synthetase [Cyanobium sp. CH-040]MCP9928676.1 bifunctional riboflavin kinase/FAD synthetase [Cyanobium sp. CH-040]